VFHAKADSLDDLMGAVFKRLLSRSSNNFKVSSRKGSSTEVFGALLELTNPRARLGRSMGRARVFSPLGELMWYLSASNALDFIQYYIPQYPEFSDDGRTLNGAYGPRIFSKGRACGEGAPQDQWQRMIEILKRRNGTRNAVIQIFSKDDAARDTKDIPCTCTLQFVIREGNISLHAHMRSNDAFLGLPHDVFSFTMLQEIAARELGVGLGSYLHSVASLHLYDDNEKLDSRSKAQQYLAEGLHEFVSMPAMPMGSPWPAIQQVLGAERKIRGGDHEYEIPTSLDPYWADLVRLIKAYSIDKTGQPSTKLEELLADIVCPAYRLYILDRIARRSGSKKQGDDLFEGIDGGRNT
jgi:thymidylate synthase